MKAHPDLTKSYIRTSGDRILLCGIELLMQLSNRENLGDKQAIHEKYSRASNALKRNKITYRE